MESDDEVGSDDNVCSEDADDDDVDIDVDVLVDDIEEEAEAIVVTSVFALAFISQ